MANPLQHVVITVKENHTFDNYFGSFPGVPKGRFCRKRPTASRSSASPRRLARGPGGGWPRATPRTTSGLIGLTPSSTPSAATTSPPWLAVRAHHLLVIAAEFLLIDNSSAHRFYQPQAPFQLESLPAVLEKHGHTWRNYAEARSSYFDHITALVGHDWNVPSAQFDLDAATGALPDVSWLSAPDGLSEHPGNWGGNNPAVKPGMAWTVGRVNALAAGPQWPACRHAEDATGPRYLASTRPQPARRGCPEFRRTSVAAP